jgi:hypothetical protein
MLFVSGCFFANTRIFLFYCSAYTRWIRGVECGGMRGGMKALSLPYSARSTCSSRPCMLACARATASAARV